MRKVLALFCVLLIHQAEAGWRVVKIGRCPTGLLEEVRVANGRNDGVKRVYVASAFDGGVYEWTYSGGGWNCVTVHSVGMDMLFVGNGRNDGTNRIYAGRGQRCKCDMTEITFSSSRWDKQDVGIDVGPIVGAVLGNGRNDEVMRLYIGIENGGVYEYTHTGSEWDKLEVSSYGGGTIDIGNGRNDGVSRVYSPAWGDKLYEFSWTGMSFSSEVIDLLPIGLTAAAIGQGRNDGVNRIYVSALYKHLYEVTYTSERWQVVDMTPSGPNRSRYCVRVGKTRSDGKYRVYATTQYGALYEYSWDGTTWQDSIVVDATTGATAYLDIGSGRNDDTARIYTTNFSTGEVYEITNTEPYYGIEEKGENKHQLVKIESYPNPLTACTGIKIYGIMGSEPLCLWISDVTGKVIRILPITNPELPVTKVVWNREDDFGNKVKPGIYFYRLKGKHFTVSKKVVVI